MCKSILISIIFLVMFFLGCVRNNETDKTIVQDSVQTKELQEVPEMKELLFVGMIGKKAGLYKYDLSAKSHSEFWHNENEEVIEFLYSPNKKSAFMLTARQSGKKGVFPFVDNIKLYSINPDSRKVKYVENIGSGLQVFSTWINDSSFQVYLHVIDVSVTEYVEQKIMTYNTSGIKVFDKKKNYYLAKEGYPKFPSFKEKFISPEKRYSVLSVDSGQTQILLIDNSNNRETTLIAKQNQKLNATDWSIDGEYLIFSTIDITPANETLYEPEPNTSQLFIYSLPDSKLVQMFDGGGIKNFTVNINYLLFDNGFKDKSKIFIYNLKSDKMIDSIAVTGGCGIRYIPIIPDYGA